MRTHDIGQAGKDCEFELVGYTRYIFHVVTRSNPMLGETFEDIRMNFVAEKVRHHPLEIAYHAEGKGWDLSATSCGKTKFWGGLLGLSVM